MVLFLAAFFWISIGLVAYSYLIYPPLISICAHLFGLAITKDKAIRPSVAFLVPVYNEEKVLRKKIENILSLNYPSDKLSIWLGSDSSTDGTHTIVKEFTDPRIHLWIAPTRGGKTQVLNQMAPIVPAEILVFTDANTMHAQESLKYLVASFADNKVGCVAGHINHLDPGSEVSGEVTYRSFESNQKRAEGRLASTISAYGGFYGIRRELFKPIPFNAYSNDDVLIPMNVLRQGFRVVFESRAISQEDTTNNRSVEFRRRIRIGAGNFQAFFWLLDFLNPLKGWVWLSYCSHKAIRWFSPILLLLAACACIALIITRSGLIYDVLGLCATLFVCIGISHTIIPLRLTKAIFYFLSMNTAFCLGLIRYCKGIKSAAWSTTQRS